MSLKSSTTATVLRNSARLQLEVSSVSPYHDFVNREGQKAQFYVDLEENCKRRAARAVSELKNGKERFGEAAKSGGRRGPDKTDTRVPRYLKDENISKIESYLSEYYMETVYQKLWEKAQNAVFGVERVN